MRVDDPAARTRTLSAPRRTLAAVLLAALGGLLVWRPARRGGTKALATAPAAERRSRGGLPGRRGLAAERRLRESGARPAPRRAPPVAARRGKLPQLLLLGCAECGARELARALLERPDFTPGACFEGERRAESHFLDAHFDAGGCEAYKRLYAGAHELGLDATPT